MQLKQNIGIFEQNTTKMSIGSKVRKYREAKNYSQEELALILEVAQTTISNIESDKNIPNAILLCKIAKTLEVGLDELFENSKSTVNHIKRNNGFVGNHNNNNTVFTLSEKIIELYEERLREKNEIITFLQSKLKD